MANTILSNSFRFKFNLFLSTDLVNKYKFKLINWDVKNVVTVKVIHIYYGKARYQWIDKYMYKCSVSIKSFHER